MNDFNTSVVHVVSLKSNIYIYICIYTSIILIVRSSNKIQYVRFPVENNGDDVNDYY